LGALGSLLSATEQIHQRLQTTSTFTTPLGDEWQAEAAVIGQISEVFDLLDGCLRILEKRG
jgi:hypothetical protein